MPGADREKRDRDCVVRMLEFCRQLEQTLAEIGGSQEKFFASATYRNAVAMCILQVGELAKNLSVEFRAAHGEIPWHLIARTRDLYAHHYGGADFELVWETAVCDMTPVREFCERFLKQ